MDSYFAEFDQMRAVALKMIELENQARIEQGMQPKVVRDWDEILVDNEVELPELPLAEQQAAIGIRPTETRYTLDEVLESIFKIVMDNYRNLGFPQVNFVMLQAKDYSPNTAEGAAGMTSDAKFKMLSQMVGGRFRPLPGMPKVDNVLDQDMADVVGLIGTDDPEEL